MYETCRLWENEPTRREQLWCKIDNRHMIGLFFEESEILGKANSWKNNQISAANSRVNLIFWRAPIPLENDEKSVF
jgi:hypothetical protein